MHKKGFRYFTSYGIEREAARTKANPHRARPVPDFMGADTIARHTTCTSKAYQRATVSVPIALKPFSEAGQPRTYCNSKPVLKEIRCDYRFHRYDYCDQDKDFDGYGGGCGNKSGDDVCYFVFTQEICIEVPIRFGAVAHADQAWVECQEASNRPCPDQESNNCGKEDEDEDEDEWRY